MHPVFVVRISGPVYQMVRVQTSPVVAQMADLRNL